MDLRPCRLLGQRITCLESRTDGPARIHQHVDEPLPFLFRQAGIRSPP
jgi:hypothetical protein